MATPALPKVDPGPVAELATPTDSEATGARRGANRRRRLWELWHKYHCPIIGTCLEVEDLRRLARKIGSPTLRDAKSDFEVHVSFVAAADEKNPLSIAVQKELERRYARSVKRFAAAKSADALRALWHRALADGEVQGAFWAVMTHAFADVELRSQAFEDVHMLSHQIGAGLRADLAALAEARKALSHLRKETESESKRQARRLQKKNEEVEQLRERVATLEGIEQAYEETRERLRELEDGRELRRLRARVAELEQENDRQGRRLADAELRAEALEHGLEAAEAEVMSLTAQVQEQTRACEALERLVGMGTAPEGCAGDDCDGCSCNAHPDRVLDLDLAGQRILCVGGRSDLAPRYRDLVQRCNGELIRHDGGLEDNRQRLEAVLASADAVICPADAVSHNAYALTKRFCKRMAKPCVLVSRSSVGAFAEALSALADSPDSQAASGPISLGIERAPRATRAA
ncbi:MAG: DUF2325 domain-containing protein [Gammaproteobacteria bacterium]|jgi:hypothetical protein|nr:DUF2325 domain-containing protein [Gammaproteobacteria bacterium]